MREDTIAAICTPIGTGAVGIVRLSGPDAVRIADAVFFARKKPSEFQPYHLYYGEFRGKRVFDRCLCVRFNAPNSFTGEDVVEFQCHGGAFLLSAVLEELIKQGARPALAGEFTRRAYLNGKLSLSAAEGLADLIAAESEESAKAAYALFREHLSGYAEEMQGELTELLTVIEAAFDYPDDEIPTVDTELTRGTLDRLLKRADDVLSTYARGRVLKNGVRVAIVGSPNVGKSSLLNALIGEDRAIVTSLAGTTRDVVEGAYFYGGVKFLLSDTAGIRDAEDEVEKIGVERARLAAKSAELVLFVADAQRELSEEEKALAFEISDCNVVGVCNKTDVAKGQSLPFETVLSVSAKTGDGLETLKKIIFDRTVSAAKTGVPMISNERHLFALRRAKTALLNAREGLSLLPADVIALELKEAWDALGEITGQSATEHIIDNIFSKLCLGK